MNNEKRKLLNALFFPGLMLISFWLVKLWEVALDTSFASYGNFPMRWEKFYGIFTMPFIHGDWGHLISNSFPFLILGTALFYFYRKHALPIFLFLFFFSGLGVWLAARPSFHIGASGVVYGLASFLIFSGFIHNNKELTSIAFIVVFIYGSMVWGVLPGREGVSWEGHLSGALAGMFAAGLFSKKIAGEQQKARPPSYYDYEDLSVSDDTIHYINYEYREENDDDS